MSGIMIDMKNAGIYSNNIPPAVYTGTTQGAAFDMSLGDIRTQAFVNVGAFVAANITSLVVQVEECTTTNGTYAAIAGMTSAITQSNLTKPIVLAGLRTLQYARANLITATGTTVSVAVEVEIFAQAKFSNSYGTTAQFGGYDRSPSS